MEQIRFTLEITQIYYILKLELRKILLNPRNIIVNGPEN
jgi:hypothetical protein